MNTVKMKESPLFLGGGYKTSESRIIWLDNVKGILIFLVVFGHIIGGEASQNQGIYGISHYLIYAIHMPMFIFISGYLSKSNPGLKKITKNYLVPYIIFDLLYVAFDFLKGGGTLDELNIFIPTYVYWYILALAILRLLSASKINKMLILIIGFAFTLLSSYIEKDVWLFLSLGRVFLLWFVFWIGLNTDYDAMMKIRIHKRISIFVGILCIVFDLVLLKLNYVSISWATHDYPNSIEESILKYLFMIFSVGVFCGLAAVVPEKCRVLERWGRNSILIYLLHPFIVDLLRFVLGRIGTVHNILLYCILFVLSAAITDFLSRNCWRKLYDSFINRLASFLRLC